MELLKKDKWDQSYARGENFIFFPKEEVVKFLNRFVRKKDGINFYKDILELSKQPKALDLGCGVGRQTILLQEFGFNSFGVDISQVALDKAKETSKAIGYEMENNFILLKKIQLPFDDDFFDIGISDSVLDSMNFSFARQYMLELDRTVKSLVYLNLISSDSSGVSEAEDVLVEDKHEEGTIQCYYDIKRVKELIKDTRFEIIQLNLNKVENLINNTLSARFNIVLKK
jgi:SAM-dependent methyltransferase